MDHLAIGSRVLDHYDRIGVVVCVYASFRAMGGGMMDRDWLDTQNRPSTDEQLDEFWYSIYHPTGGATRACHSNLVLLTPEAESELTGLPLVDVIERQRIEQRFQMARTHAGKLWKERRL